MQPIYLDHNSTTPLLPEVAEAIVQAARIGDVNPASQHQLGQRARRRIEEARERILELLGGQTTGMRADRLIFTSGGTEANNTLLRGLLPAPPARLVISSLEHPSMLGPAEYLQSQGYDVQRIRALPQGTIDLDHACALIEGDPRPALVSVMLANNETGVVQPLNEVAELCAKAGVSLITDAVQAITKIACPFRDLNVAAMTVAPHKFHGPVGIGAILLRHDVKLNPLLFGGFQQEGLRPGTESVLLASGFLAALEAAERDVDRPQRMAELRDTLEAQLREELGDMVVINGASAQRLPTTSNIAFRGLNRQELLLALDAAGICCSTGSACASGSSEPSPVLQAMGLEADVIEGSLRLSVGAGTTAADIALASSRISRCVKDLQLRQNRRKSAVPPRHEP